MNGAGRTVVLALTACVAACGYTVTPRTLSVDAPSSRGGVTSQLTMQDTARFAITIDPWRSTTFDLGAGNTLRFPAGSVCDPNHSTYGDGEWDTPCAAARTPMTETVSVWLDAHGKPRVAFSPDLRFVPSALPVGWVMLTFSDREPRRDATFNILYCAHTTSPCVDEAHADSTLRTVRNPLDGTLTRRIKHFSGYRIEN